jgi:AraC-like DNA-binding protein
MKRKDTRLILEIREYLDENLYCDHSIQSLCRQFAINREKLQTGFHDLVHTTVHAYIVGQRLERAAQRLLETDDSIKAIALDSGYKKQRSFNKTFKSIYNVTPASYRRLHQQREETKS